MTDTKFNKIKYELLYFISENYFVPKEEIDIELSLVDSGIIDSIGLIEISSWITENYEFPVTEDDMSHENFGSVVKIVEFILSNHVFD